MQTPNLNTTDSRFQTLMDKMLEGVQIYDKNWNCIYVNQEAERQRPYSKEGISGYGIMDTYPGIEETGLLPILEQCKKEKKSRHIEHEFTFPDGTKKWFELRLQPNQEEFFILSVDITERKKAEQELLRSNKQLLMSQEIAGVGYWETDLVGDDHYWSEEMYRLLEMEKTTGVVDETSFLTHVFPEDRQAVLDAFRGIIFSNKTSEVEFRFTCKDGSTRYFYSTGHKMVMEGNRVLRVNGTIQDVSRRKLIELEITKEKNLSDSIINSMPGTFYFYDINGKFLRWNSNMEKVSKYTGEEISSMHPLDFFEDPERELIKSKIETVFTHGEAEVEAGFLTKDNQKIPYSFTGKAIKYGDQTFLMGLGIDISERTKTENAVKEYSEQLRQLAAHLQDVREEERISISREIHDELGQQLTGIKMDLFWLKSEFPISNEVRKYIDRIIELADSSINTVRSISSALRPFILDDLGLIEAMKNYCLDFQNRYNITTVFNTNVKELDTSSKIVIGLFRIFQESLTNVVRHAKASSIHITLEQSDTHLMLQIEDDGVGFDPQGVAHKKTLGLLGMKERVLMINGKSHIESCPGQGTRSSFIIPLKHQT